MGANELYLYLNNPIAEKAFLSFNKSVYAGNIKGLNSYIFSLIGEYEFEKIFVSITSSNSIFYRFKLEESSYEFKWEIFYDFNQDPDSDVESILHIYKDNIKIKSTFGFIDFTYDKINAVIDNEKMESRVEPFPAAYMRYYEQISFALIAETKLFLYK
jgi:hypothetical protein